MSSSLPRISHPARRLLLAQIVGVYIAATLIPNTAWAVPTTPPASLAQTPQFLQLQPAPNVFITIDNSGSMLQERLPDDPPWPSEQRMFPTVLGAPYAESGDGAPVTSGSMGSFVGFSHHINVARNRSSAHNLGYYDPRIRYRPWKATDAAGNLFNYPEAADPAAGDTTAFYHPVHPARGGLDLASSTFVAGAGVAGAALEDSGRAFSGTYTALFDASVAVGAATTNVTPEYLATNPGDAVNRTVPFALYYVFDPGAALPNCVATGADQGRDDLDCYRRIEIKPSVTQYVIPAGNQRGQADEPGCAPDGSGTMICNYEAEFRNFANWFQYYRSRTLLARGAMGNAVADLADGFRVGLGLINATSGSSNDTYNVDGFVSTTVRVGVRTFTGPHRGSVYNVLHNHAVNGTTPSGRALWEVGDYFNWKSGAGANDPPHSSGPWADQPGVTGTEFASCRQSYHVYSTDGYWNENRGSLFSGKPTEVQNADDSTGPEICPPGVASGGPGCYQYNPTAAIGTFTEALTNTNNRRYRNTDSQTLADIAMYYWYRDLQPGIPNRVTPSSADPAFWQHLSTFAVALALVGKRTAEEGAFLTKLDTAEIDPATGQPTVWPQPLTANGGDPGTADDLWHAAVNSRGRLLIANNPQELSSRLSRALNEIRSRSANGAGAASSSAFISDDAGSPTAVFTAEFTQGSWSGDLYRREFLPGTLQFRTTDASGNPLPVDANGQPYVWRASQVAPVLNAPGSRRIFTMRTGSSPRDSVVEFRPQSFATGGVDATQDALLASPLGTTDDVINYLRGDRTKEQSSVPPGNFRDRPRASSGSVDNVLGTIANSSPLYVKDANFLYNFLPSGTPGANTYLAYQRANHGDGTQTGATSGRTPLIWVGSNGGMFHAFNAITDTSRSRVGGAEAFAYVPRAVIRNLAQLVDPTYQHRLMVDGVPAAGDAYLEGGSCTPVAGVDPCWRTLVVSSLGAGGRSVFAIDATQPEALDASSILWELDEYSLSATNYEYLGHSFGPAFIARVKDNTRPSGGRWVAVFGNGPESGNKRAALFVVDAFTGQLVVPPIDTGDGDALNPNGLTSPAPLLDADRQLIGVYAGDIRGNLWKFDLSGANPTTWGVAFGGAPMFQARSRTGQRQPIFAKPAIAPHPAGGVIVAFGTGKMFSPGDRENTDEQTLYAVRDNLAGNPPLDANFRSGSTMVQQAITAKSGTPASYFLTSFPVNYSTVGGKRGWYLDLGVRYTQAGAGVDTSSATAVTPRERMVLSPQVNGDTLSALSLVPSTDPCAAGGESFLYALDVFTGSFIGTGSFTSAGDRSGAVLTPAGSGLLQFFRRGSRGPSGSDGPGGGNGGGSGGETPPVCPPGFTPAWIPGINGGGHYECVPGPSKVDVRSWRQIIE